MDCGFLKNRAILIKYTTYFNEFHEKCEEYKKIGTFWCNIKSNGYKKTKTNKSKLEKNFERSVEDVFLFTVTMRKYEFSKDVEYIAIDGVCYEVLEKDLYQANDTVKFICQNSDLDLNKVGELDGV